MKKSEVLFMIMREIIIKSPEKYGVIKNYTLNEIEAMSKQLLTTTVVNFINEYQKKVNKYFNIPLDIKKVYLKDQTLINIKETFRYYRSDV